MARIGFWAGNRKVSRASDEPTDLRSDADSASHVVHSPHQLKPRPALELLQTFEHNAQGWFWSTDVEGRITYITANVASLSETDLSGSAFVELFTATDASDDCRPNLAFSMMKRAKLERLTLCTYQGDAERWWTIWGYPQLDPLNQFVGYRGWSLDVSDQRQQSEAASQLAMHDSLTGLPNRLRFGEALEKSLVVHDYQKRSCALLLIDLDRFKQVNDTLGHPVGDALLKQVADRLLCLVGNDDVERVFRLGGDEFMVVMPDCQDRSVLGNLAERTIASLSQPYSVKGSRCVIGASIGVAISPFDGRSLEELTRNADLALYAAKDAGRGRFQLFTSDLLQVAEDKRVLEEDLRDALAKGEIKVFYQPIVDAITNVTTGVEALVRWHHAERGWISPALFIPIAEETNLIEALGEWVLRKACEDAARWPGKIRVAVNVSPIQFKNESLPAIVLSALAASGLAPEQLELEITEGVFLGETGATDTMFETLKNIGVRLALDDFGTGYSSLSYLKSAPFDKIKIDQSFVREATLPRSRNRAIIAAIVALAEALGMETTAEGIETHDQLDLVRALRVSHVQGYIYSKPIAFEEMTANIGVGKWEIPPSGPARQRAKRHAMFRKAGAIYGNHYRGVLVRNLSRSGALIEGLDAVPLGSLLLLDFGEGQLAFARLRRRRGAHAGVEFEQPMVSDGSGGLCTRERVSAYTLAKAGLPTADAPAAEPTTSNGESDGMEGLRKRLGMGMPLGAGNAEKIGSSISDGGSASEPSATEKPVHDVTAAAGESPQPATARMPTIEQLGRRHLEQVRRDQRRYRLDKRLLEQDVLPNFGTMRPDQITPSLVSEWLTRRAASTGLPATKATQIQAIFGQLYILAMQHGVSGGSTVSPNALSFYGQAPLERSLSACDLERLYAATRASSNPQLKHIVSLLILTGTRQRELLGAQWHDVDLVAHSWTIPSAGSASARTITLSSAAVAAFCEVARIPGCDHVIVNPRTAKPYHSFFSSWDAARKKANLADVELDDLRHNLPLVTDNSPEPVDLVSVMLRQRSR